MLVLTRKLEEQIRIGDDITISILRVKGNTVRVGIDAPRSIRVVRGELPNHESTAREPSDRPAPSAESAESSDRESDARPSTGDTLPGELQKPDPATTAVRQFIANRARRRHGGRVSHQAGQPSLAAALTRSA